MRRARRFSAPLWLALVASAQAVAGERAAESPSLEALVAQTLPDVRAWRRDLHAHPELSNREVRTSKLVAKALRAEGYEVRTGVAHTGVIGVLRGAGPVVALRADMDALPVTEETGLPFASHERATYEGHEVGVMHACGHDAHTAMLLGVAKVLAARRFDLGGTVVLLFQPAEEGAPRGERGGAKLMLEEGAFDAPRPDAVFGLHVTAELPVGHVGIRSGAATASSDRLTIRVKGRQSHAASPWQGVDPIATASRIVLEIESLPAREVDVRIPSVVSIGSFQGGVRNNIIPDEVELQGTIRSLDPQQRAALHEKVRRSAQGIAQASGAEAEVAIEEGNPMVWNDPALLARMRPALERAAGAAEVEEMRPWTAAEDFAFYAQQVPGLFFWLGVRRPDVAVADAAQIHTPRFDLDEAALPLGVRAMSELALAFLHGSP
ncbi:MAG TPA: amidohydrolase [Myxococcota bacterium]|nr:amidohydrolase [Myxococcota bacterium]